MRFITRDVDYAIRSLIFMCRALREKDKRIITVDNIVSEEKLPRVFLRRILQKLADKRILLSYKGKSGGFSFRIQPSKISFADIIKVFQGKIDLTNCFLKEKTCPNVSTCNVRKKIKTINAHVTRDLEKITIQGLSKKR